MTQSGPELEVGFTHAPLTVLGPGRRVGLWLMGCGRGCPGCLSPDLWQAGPESRRPVKEIFKEMESVRRETRAAGLTISGGEPFQQAEGLKALLTLGQAAGWADVLIYSGFLMKELLAAHPWLPDLATAVVDGPYEQGRPSREIWRGSAGQTLTLFKPELAGLYETWRHDETRKAQIIVSEPGGFVRLLGIPGPGDYDRLRNELKGAGHDQDL
jgi:anaerobic ribonucleoside-triphosphate reductase activating protein